VLNGGLFFVALALKGKKQMAESTVLVPGRLLREKQFVGSILPISRAAWWAGVKSGKFPQPVKLGSRTTCWRSEDILKIVAEGAE
jgi:predicted DNA-binding transcriptional regulator AlpA